MTAERQQFRERIRREAGKRFAHGEKTAVIAKDLRVSGRSVRRWRRTWREGGTEALTSKGPPRLPKLSDVQFAELEKQLELGVAAHGWEDQRWTLLRIKGVIARKFRITPAFSPKPVARLGQGRTWGWAWVGGFTCHRSAQ
ncbi:MULTISPECIES: helix-turn-helix domain-containing protein [unclassified Streptomyces]|uniref:helix-turn-helix domain-containing protein n=1 Tax=unclassified Streptomyces TaxID=2593676 RepID=UPI0037F54BD5